MSSRPETRPGGASPAPPPTTPFAPGQENIWTDVLALNKADAKARGDVGRPDAALFVLGASGSGKTTLLRRILYGGGDGQKLADSAPPKPGEGMEYHYARRARGGDSDRKDVAHVWEISGARAFADAISSKESVFFGARQVTTATALIVVDLSKPLEAVPTLEYWLRKTRAAVDRTFDKLRGRGSRLPEQLVNRHKKQFKAIAARRFAGASGDATDSLGEGTAADVTPDDLAAGILASEHFAGVQIVVACTKADLHRREEAEPRRVLSRALRRLAHFNGASLFYVDCLSAATGTRSVGSANGDVSNFHALRAYVNHCVFVGADVPFGKRVVPAFDHLRDVLVIHGQDRASAIGAPRVDHSGSHATGLESDIAGAWRAACARVFAGSLSSEGIGSRKFANSLASASKPWVEGGETDAEGNASSSTDAEKYAEPEVDATRARKTEELESFKKQQQMLLRQGPAVAR